MYYNVPTYNDDDNNDDNNDENDIYTQMAFDEDDHLDAPKVHKRYYIGICCLINNQSFLYLNSVSPKTLFKYNFEDVMYYLKRYSIMYSRNPRLHIMQLIKDNDDADNDDACYNVLLKTHWIRLVQRHWKSRFRAWLIQITSLEYIKRRPITNRPLSRPSLKGMLSHYAKSNALH